MHELRCKICYRGVEGRIYQSSLYPSICACSMCLDRIHYSVCQLMGREFVQTVCGSMNPHPIKELAMSGMFYLSGSSGIGVMENAS